MTKGIPFAATQSGAPVKASQPLVHPWHLFGAQDRPRNIVEGGRGLHVWGEDGKRYLDAVGGLWCSNIGLGDEEMAQAIADQTRKLSYANIFGDLANKPALDLAREVANRAPENLSRVFFTTGGSTAIDTAVRLIDFYQNARGQPKRRFMIARQESYHGSTYIGMSLTGKSGDRLPWFNYETSFIRHVSAPYTYRAPDNMDEQAFCDFLIAELEETILELGPESVAAFFAEPILGSGGVIVPPANYNRRTWEICRKYDILYVADEVVTGFGRLGHWFASRALFDVEPDIITCAKGLSSGYLPIGAVIFSDSIFETISVDPTTYFAHGFTYSGHPVCCAAALKNIEIIEREHLLEHVQEVGPYFMERLQGLANLPIVGDVRGMGLMVCIENVGDRRTKDLIPDELAIGSRIAHEARDRGLIVRPIGHLNILSPALILSRNDIDFIADTLDAAIRSATDSAIRDGARIA